MKIKQKQFKHSLLEAPQNLIRVDGEIGGRYYLIEGSTDRFYSVTNILSTMIKSKELEKWKKDLGDKALQITKKASERGMALHTYCEKYLLNESIEDLMAEAQQPLFQIIDPSFNMFMRVREVLDKDVDDILGIELPLFSRRLQVAGTPDVIGHYKKKLSIIDFKTIKGAHKITPQRILKYFLQGVFYSIMVKEIYDIEIRQVVLIFGTEADQPPTVLRHKIEDRDIERVERLVEGFNLLLEQQTKASNPNPQ